MEWRPSLPDYAVLVTASGRMTKSRTDLHVSGTTTFFLYVASSRKTPDSRGIAG